MDKQPQMIYLLPARLDLFFKRNVQATNILMLANTQGKMSWLEIK